MPGRRHFVDTLTKCIPHPNISVQALRLGRYSVVGTPEEAAHRQAVRDQERQRRDKRPIDAAGPPAFRAKQNGSKVVLMT